MRRQAGSSGADEWAIVRQSACLDPESGCLHVVEEIVADDLTQAEALVALMRPRWPDGYDERTILDAMRQALDDNLAQIASVYAARPSYASRRTMVRAVQSFALFLKDFRAEAYEALPDPLRKKVNEAIVAGDVPAALALARGERVPTP